MWPPMRLQVTAGNVYGDLCEFKLYLYAKRHDAADIFPQAQGDSERRGRFRDVYRRCHAIGEIVSIQKHLLHHGITVRTSELAHCCRLFWQPRWV